MVDYQIEKAQSSDIPYMLECYDSGNELFDLSERANGNIDLFKDIYDSNIVYVLKHNINIIGWISYKIIYENAILTGLYVKKTYHKNGVGGILLIILYHQFTMNLLASSIN